ncbi:hypothetical protein [Falsiroseomonas sp. E2-1-a20]|uniref:hypothetical protein n=1 Tax=Falsiroseomonas sp. E2-1-a20 TaxID=3239300 RepID=UPI003F2E5C5C
MARGIRGATAFFWAIAALSSPLLAQTGPEAGGFVGRETREIVEICALRPGLAQYPGARAFCHGYLTGAYSTLLADRPAGAPPLHCNLPASRQEPIDRFVAWAQARPDQLRAFPPNAFLQFMDVASEATESFGGLRPNDLPCLRNARSRRWPRRQGPARGLPWLSGGRPTLKQSSRSFARAMRSASPRSPYCGR